MSIVTEMYNEGFEDGVKSVENLYDDKKENKSAMLHDHIISGEETCDILSEYKRLIRCHNSLYNMVQLQNNYDILSDIKDMINAVLIPKNNMKEAPVHNLKLSILVLNDIVKTCLDKGLINDTDIVNSVKKIINE